MGLRGFWCRLVSFDLFFVREGGDGGRRFVWVSGWLIDGVCLVCITLGPTWFTAAIYVTLSKM